MRVGFVHAALAIAAEPRIPANWARSAARISCTASLRPWRCLTVGGQGDHRTSANHETSTSESKQQALLDPPMSFTDVGMVEDRDWWGLDD